MVTFSWTLSTPLNLISAIINFASMEAGFVVACFKQVSSLIDQCVSFEPCSLARLQPFFAAQFATALCMDLQVLLAGQIQHPMEIAGVINSAVCRAAVA